ncbi:cyclin-like protein [Lophiotrema nucula]|uniref:Transcription initiation factor IIB n=1 Tax=Lophiotrema nucula TaxID=690887 RepID=A0A6A5Z683_9PLEO|nr:cyclin-like protein [Lophiotrema nucula]
MAYDPWGRQLSPGEQWEHVKAAEEEKEWQEDLNIILICPDCREDPPNLIENFSSGDTVCTSCGRVMTERIIDMRSEWRTFADDDGKQDQSRVGEAADPLLNGNQLSTEIAYDPGARHGALARALHNTNQADKTDVKLRAAYTQIQLFCDSGSIPKIASETAKLLYKQASDTGTLRGTKKEHIVAAALIIACRQHDISRSFKEITKLTGVSVKKIGVAFNILRDMVQNQEKEKQQKAGANNEAHPEAIMKKNQATDASDLIARACNRLGLGYKLSSICQEAATRVAELGIGAGRSPLSIAAAVIYMVSHLMGQKRSAREIGDVLEVSDGTVRIAYKVLYTRIDDLVAKDWLERGGDVDKLP